MSKDDWRGPQQKYKCKKHGIVYGCMRFISKLDHWQSPWFCMKCYAEFMQKHIGVMLPVIEKIKDD